MHALLANLTAAMLLFQAATGACWQKPDGCKENATALAGVHSGCCDDGCGEEPANDPSPEPCKCKLECLGICTYTLPEHAPCLDVCDLWVDAVFLDSLALSIRAEVPTWARDSSHPLSSGPTRLHLLHQVILI